MGALITAPIAGIGTCAASMCGGCLAAGCCKLATAGSTDTTKAARCVLLWLQVVAVLLGVLMSWNPKGWLDWPCDHIFTDFGICECRGGADESSCYSDQIIYRTEASAVLVFVLLLILCVSGCAKHAAKSCPIGKFLILMLLIVILLFVPNDVLSVFGSIAGVASSVYLVAQTVLLMDFAYGWNEAWHTNAQKRQRDLNQQGYKMWLIAIVVASAGLFILGLVEMILLCVNFTTGGARALVVTTFIVGFVLLFISITEWCEHGALLTSALVLAYMMWLSYEALSMLPLSDGGVSDLLPRWVGLIVCAVSLAAFAYSASFSGKKATVPMAAGQEGLTEQGQAAGTAAAEEDEDDDTPEDLDVSDFTVQCTVHATAAVYIASSLAPSRGSWTFNARVAAVVVSLALYGWTLIAPKVLKNRQF